MHPAAAQDDERQEHQGVPGVVRADDQQGQSDHDGLLFPDIPRTGPAEHVDRHGSQGHGAQHRGPATGGYELGEPEPGAAALAVAFLLEIAGEESQDAYSGHGQVRYVEQGEGGQRGGDEPDGAPEQQRGSCDHRNELCGHGSAEGDAGAQGLAAGQQHSADQDQRGTQKVHMRVVYRLELDEGAPRPDGGDVRGQAATRQGGEHQDCDADAHQETGQLEGEVPDRVGKGYANSGKVDFGSWRIDGGHVRPVNGSAQGAAGGEAEGRNRVRWEKILGTDGPAVVVKAAGGEEPVRPEFGDRLVDGHVGIRGDARLLNDPVPGIPRGIVAGPRRCAYGYQAEQHCAGDEDGSQPAAGYTAEGKDGPGNGTPGEQGSDDRCRFERVVRDNHPPQQSCEHQEWCRHRCPWCEPCAARCPWTYRGDGPGPHTAVLDGHAEGDSRQKTRP